MTDTTAKIRAKGLDGTGFTEDLAARLFNNVGANLKAIIELQVVDKHGPNLDGKRGIELVITQLEVADNIDLEDHLRELTQTLYYNRGLDGHTGTTTEGQERTVADVMASGQHFRPHPFLPVDASQDNPICDVCGSVEASAQHSQQDVLDQPDDPENPAEPALDVSGFDEQNQLDDERAEEAAEAIDEAYADGDPLFDGPHAYDAGPDDVCLCGAPFEDEIHRFVGETGLSVTSDPFTVPATT
ncbi:MAG TPA: hypothetical protein VGE38_07050 [Nocardioides sp.]|uniref:hypothetical protein n=1 Tax=Nocardioides sp. TaxID=35761 RepID=UPI002ED9B5A0